MAAAVLFNPVTALAIPYSAIHAGTPASRQDEQSQALTEGFQALQKGELSSAESAFNNILKSDARHTGAMLGLAEVRLKQGDGQGAQAWLKRALGVQPDDPDVLVAQGRYLVGQGKYAEAQTVLVKAADRSPQSFSAHRSLGDLYLNGLRKPAAAVASYRRAVALEANSAAARFGLAMALLASRDSSAALTELAEAARLAPSDPAADHLAGRIHAAEKRFDPALASLDKALRISPDFLPALSDRADIHAERGHEALAAADYEHLLRLSPQNATARLKLGMMYQRLDRLDDARKAYLVALENNADLAVAWNNLAMISLRRGEKSDQAVVWAKKAVALAPKVPQFHDTLGWSYRAQGDRIRATAALETASNLQPVQADIVFRLGTVYEEADRKAEAKAAYARALSLKSDFAEAAQARARLAALSK